MVEIWIHRKCARPQDTEGGGDELILPKRYDHGKMCEICKRAADPVYLHEGREVAESIPNPIAKGLDIVKELIDEGKAVLEAATVGEGKFVKGLDETIEIEAETVEEDKISVGEPVTVLEEPPEVEPEPSEPLAEKPGEPSPKQAKKDAKAVKAEKKAAAAKKTEIERLKAELEALEK